MKIKRFNNLWTMGLILTMTILVILYIFKLISPKFIIKIAETKNILKFGNYVDNHLWCYYLFNGFTSYIIMFLYTCACCRILKLDLIENIVLVASIILSFVVQRFFPTLYLSYNFMGYIFLPLIVVFKRKLSTISIFYSTCICFLITTLAQYLSLEIRGISTLINYPNTATYFVLLIDLYIWNILLYLFYNYKKGGVENG